MRILVVGGTRFIGPFVVRRLVENGHDVTVLHRGRSEPELPPSVRHLHHPGAGFGQRAALGEIRDEVARLAPEVVVDMVPLTEGDARALGDLCRGVAARLVAVSSQDVYLAYDVLRGKETCPPVPVPIDEASPLRTTLHPYRSETPPAAGEPPRLLDDYDKILVERIVLGDPVLPGTVLRLPMVYGPGDYQHRVHPYLKRMDDRRPAIVLDARHAVWRDTRGYVGNVAHAIALAAEDERAAGRVYNVGEATALSEVDWIAAIARAAGWRGSVVSIAPERLPDALRTDVNVAQEFVVDTSRIRDEIGFREVTATDEAMERTVAWERAHPPATIDPAAFDYVAEDAVIAAM